MRRFIRLLFVTGSFWIGIGVGFLFIFLYIFGYVPFITRFIDALELKAYDFRFIWRGPVKPGPEVVLVVIDEKSLGSPELGRWPWPRRNMAMMIDAIAAEGPRAVALDVFFSEPEQDLALTELASRLQNTDLVGTPVYQKVVEELAKTPTGDQLLGYIMKNTPGLVEGYFFHTGPAQVAHLSQEERDKSIEAVATSRYKLVSRPTRKIDQASERKLFAAISNFADITNPEARKGYINVFPDSDGVIRWYTTFLQNDADFYSPLAVQAVATFLGRENIRVNLSDYGSENIRFGRKAVGIDETGRMLLNFYGPERSFPHYSAIDVLRGEIPQGALEDKIVVFGATAVGIYDLRTTPYQAAFPGMEVQATAMDNMLHGRFLYRPEWLKIWDLAMMLIIAVVMALLLVKLPATLSMVLGLALLVGNFFLNEMLFSRYHIWANLAYPTLEILGILLATLPYRLLVEEKDKRFIHNAFGHYLSPHVIENLVDNPDALALGGEQREITAVFTDVAGFTTISESLSAQELVELLNEYLTAMSEIILAHDGTLDKFEGDAIIAFFGAPLEQPDHAAEACFAALEMQAELDRLEPMFKERNWPRLNTRIGLNSGPAVVGNMGSRQRMDYTMMGDTVNLAARLEGTNKAYGTNLLVGQNTYDQVQEVVEARMVDVIRVVGKKEPVRIYQILGRKGEPLPGANGKYELYREAFQQYQARRFTEAITTLERALGIDAQDGPSRTLIQRCREFLETPPPDDWDGVHVMTSK